MKLNEYLNLDDYKGTEEWKVVDVYFDRSGYSDEVKRIVIAQDPDSNRVVTWEQKSIVRDGDSYVEYVRHRFG